MNRKIILEYILFFYLSLYITQQSLNAYYNYVVCSPSNTFETIKSVTTEQDKKENIKPIYYDGLQLPINKIKDQEPQLVESSSNIIMAWNKGKGEIGYHSFSSKDFLLLQEFAENLSAKELEIALDNFKKINIDEVLSILHNPQKKQEMIQLAKLSTKKNLGKF